MPGWRMRKDISIALGETDRHRLEALVADRNTPRRHVRRARIVLLSADGVGANGVMAATGAAKTTFWRWRARFMAAGVAGQLRDKTRPPGRAPVADGRAAAIVAMTLKPPPHEATHWTARAMARAVGLAGSTVRKIWKAHGLAPHRWRAFKLSNDPAFAEKRHDVVGLYVAPPAHAAAPVSTRSRKSRRSTAPSRACRRTGKVVHVILDNDAAQKHAKVRAWLDRHLRWTLHFTPTLASWLNAAAGFLGRLTRRRLKNGVFRSVVDLQPAINRFLAEHNQNPRPFNWRADPDAIFAARNREFQTSGSIQ